MPLSEFITVWALLAMNIASPGPNVLNTIAAAIGSGRAAGMGSAMGVGLGIGIWCLGMSLGMAAVFVLVPTAQTVMTVFAAGLLGFFASRYLRAARTGWRSRNSLQGGDPAPPPGRVGLSPKASFLRSLGVNAANPKALTSWLAVLSIFPTAGATGGDIAVLTLGACLLSLAIHAAYAVAFSTPVAARAYLRAAPMINLGVAIFFTGFAITLLIGLKA